MTQHKAHRGLDFGALCHAIERCEPDLILGFYAEEANLSIVNADAPHALPFELRGKTEIAKHLRVAFNQETSHRVEEEVVGEDRVTYSGRHASTRTAAGSWSRRRWRCTTARSFVRWTSLQRTHHWIERKRSAEDHPFEHPIREPANGWRPLS